MDEEELRNKIDAIPEEFKQGILGFSFIHGIMIKDEEEFIDHYANEYNQMINDNYNKK